LNFVHKFQFMGRWETTTRADYYIIYCVQSSAESRSRRRSREEWLGTEGNDGQAIWDCCWPGDSPGLLVRFRAVAARDQTTKHQFYMTLVGSIQWRLFRGNQQRVCCCFPIQLLL